MSLQRLFDMNGAVCSCGRIHRFSSDVICGKGAIRQLPAAIRRLGGSRVFVLSDQNTFEAAGKQVLSLLEAEGFPYVSYSFPQVYLEPDEQAVGSAVMHYDASCDLIVSVGSGVLNDIGKILSSTSGRPYIIVGTAPSMDGYASASSSMTRDGLKISLPTRCADVILGDTDILKHAPLHMMKAGLGDMLAKYISICEWRYAHLLCGEYYCGEIADLIRHALGRCMEQADGLLRREDAAVEAVFEGLVIGGVAMNYAGLSRPASGFEHYISHIIDMRAAEFGTPCDLHGIQCAVGTLIAARMYSRLSTVQPDREKALAHAAAFDLPAWHETLRQLLGKGAESMIALEKKERKYDLTSHAERLERILARWEDILTIIREEVPAPEVLEDLLHKLDAPTTLRELGTDEALLPVIAAATRDIRDKYVLSRLAWDLGIPDELL